MPARRLIDPTIPTLLALALTLPAAPARAEPPRPLTLTQCLAIAAERSPALAIERERLSEAAADRALAAAGLFPRVSVSAYAQRLDPHRLAPSIAPAGKLPAPPLYAEEAFAGIRVKQVLFDGLRAWNARGAAGRGVEAAEGAVSAARADAVVAVTQAFVRLVEAQELTRVARDALSRQRAFEDLATALASAGRGSRVDPIRARAQRLEAERALIAAREAEAIAGAGLRRVVGLDDGRPIAAAGGLPDAGPATADDADWVQRALRTNLDLRKLDLLVAQARSAEALAAGTWAPEISLQGAYGLRGRDVGGRAPEWSGGIFVEWTPFEGGAGQAGAEKAAARRRQLEEARRALVLELESDVREALGAWRVAAASAGSTAESVVATREAAELALALYRAGRATALDVQSAELEAVRAEAARIQALGDHAVARARVARLAGPEASAESSRSALAPTP